MSSTSHAKAVSSEKKTYTVAVIGNPNCGKTTLFNRLTGLRQKVGNYPGVTVEKREGHLSANHQIRLIDLPGTYSLSVCSPDEQVARDVLLGHMADTPKPDAVVLVLDTYNLERNLYLASQVMDLGLPTVVACNMIDLLEKSGYQLKAERLSEMLGVPVIPTVGQSGLGIQALQETIQSVCALGKPQPRHRKWAMPAPLEEAVEKLGTELIHLNFAEESSAQGLAILLLSEGGSLRCDHLPDPVRRAVEASAIRLATENHLEPPKQITLSRYTWLSGVAADSLTFQGKRSPVINERLDRIFTHRIWGIVIFAVLMGAMFYSVFILAEPFMGMLESLVAVVKNGVAEVMSAGALRDLIIDGALAGVGAVVVFLPQICLLFLFLAVLEDTGYMSRAAFVMERLMRRVGLPGKSFIPLLSSHACAIPGIMATRTIENPRDRLVTILVAPLMSCSARLPVYTILIAACLPGGAWLKAFVLLGLYLLGLVAALAMAKLFKKTILGGPPSSFLIELPPYRMPRLAAVLRVMWERSSLFISRAGTIILAMTIVIWALMNYPKDQARMAGYDQQIHELRQQDAPAENISTVENQRNADILAHSVAGRLGQWIEPVIKPLGYDWKIGVGLISSFAAREMFVSTMGIMYSVGDADEQSDDLRDEIRKATRQDGTTLFTPLVAVSLMVFYALACQCVSTIAIVRRETNSWRWPAFMFVYMTALAYVVSLLVYQIGRAL